MSIFPCCNNCSISTARLDRVVQVCAITTLAVGALGIVSLVFTQLGYFHPFPSPLIGIGLLTSTIPMGIFTHCLGNELRQREYEER